MFTNVNSDGGKRASSFGDVGQAVEQGGEGRLCLRLGIGREVLVAFPRQSKPLGVEAAEQPHQQPLARNALFADQFALVIDLLDAAVDGAVEGEGGELADRELLRGVPGAGESGGADRSA